LKKSGHGFEWPFVVRVAMALKVQTRDNNIKKKLVGTNIDNIILSMVKVSIPENLDDCQR